MLKHQKPYVVSYIEKKVSAIIELISYKEDERYIYVEFLNEDEDLHLLTLHKRKDGIRIVSEYIGEYEEADRTPQADR